MICYFRKDFKPSIKVKIKQQDQASTSFEEIVQKAVNAKAKVGLRSSTIVRNLNACCPRSHRSSYNTLLKVQTQSSKDFFCSKELKPKNLKSALPYDNMAEPAKKQGEMKKRSWRQKRKHTRERKEQFLATNVNIKASKKKIKTRCFNCNKKGHYINNCTKPKNQRGSQ